MKKSVLPIFLLFLVGIIACKKSSNNTVTNNNTPGPFTDITSVFTKWVPAAKTVTIDAATGGSFYTNNGSRVIITPGCFQTSTGGTVTGNVQVQVQDYLSKADMIFSGVLPISNGEPLISGGEFFISATQAGQPLVLKPFSTFRVNLPQSGAGTTGMQLFTAVTPATGNVNWRAKIQDTATGTGIVIDGDTISLFNDSLQFCNADRFMSSPNYQSFKINITGVTLTDSSKIHAWAVYDNFNGMWGMQSITNGVITEGHVPDIPVHFLIIGIINGNLYSGIKATTPASDSVYTIILSPIDTTSLKNQVSKL